MADNAGGGRWSSIVAAGVWGTAPARKSALDGTLLT